MSVIPGLGGLGGMLGNLTTALIDKYAYGRDISVGEIVFTTILSGVAGAAFGAASIPFAFEVGAKSIWYNAARMGWAICTTAINAVRTFLTSFVFGIFSFGRKNEKK